MPSETLFDKLVRESRERERVATPGPWKKEYVRESAQSKEYALNIVKVGEVSWRPPVPYTLERIVQDTGDAEFIAHARTMEPAWREALKVAVDLLEEYAEIEENRAKRDGLNIGSEARLVLAKINRILAERTEEK